MPYTPSIATSWVRKLNNNLEWICPITLEPKGHGEIYVLNCGHSFSFAITRCATRINSISTLSCPICRKTMTSLNDLSQSTSLTPNYALMALVMQRGSRISTQDTQTCTTHVQPFLRIATRLRVNTMRDRARSDLVLVNRSGRKELKILKRKFKELQKEHVDLKEMLDAQKDP